MNETTKNETTLKINSVERKSWHSPKMTELNIRETKSADRPGNWEIDLYFFQIGGTAS